MRATPAQAVSLCKQSQGAAHWAMAQPPVHTLIAQGNLSKQPEPPLIAFSFLTGVATGFLLVWVILQR
jgi:hypothetical protein